MSDIIFPIMVLIITGFSILNFLTSLFVIINISKKYNKITDNHNNILNWKYTISTKDNENE